ncbi:MAG: DNA polymerase IV [Acidimicrobiia bacterium]
MPTEATGSPSILHADLDAFYASVEQLLDPSLRGIPMAVGGGVVLAASYEARAFGVEGGMSGRTARRLCPGLRFVAGHFSEYERLAAQVMAVLEDFTPVVERVSIDEAFLDVSGSRRLFGPPRAIAVSIRGRVRDEIGLPISVGAATTKHLAKVASQVAKPDGLVVVEPGTEDAFLEPLPVGLLWGVGPVMQQRLHDLGIRTIGELAGTAPEILQSVLGHAIGHRVGLLATNEDSRAVTSGTRAGSIGSQSALGRVTPTQELLWSVLGRIADRVTARLRRAARAARTVSVRVRFADLRSISRSTTLDTPTASTRVVAEVAVALVESALADHPDQREISLLAISLSKLIDAGAVQLELPLAGDGDLGLADQRAAVDAAVDQVRARFGARSVGYARSELLAHEGVPDDFRRLAEREV